MKGIVIYDTSYGNTQKIAEAIADTLKESGIHVDTTYVKNIKKLNAEDYDFLIIGSPTRFATMSLTMRGFLSRLKPDEWINKPFAAFDTEGSASVEKNQGSAAEKIAQKLKEKQMNQLLPVLKAIVLDWKGPLQTGEIERAKEYAQKFLSQIKQQQLVS
ncbi:MAG: flavodoxin family protein [Dehalococcoidales bacterium]|jgi:menaquinone-dependent protoporphyrinogen IX oxidase|nr:flavodoxin family protein [Dehalococcoidales bacterium]